jgi:ATP-dependent exoDNAse (exonuclease V) alpha subunit
MTQEEALRILKNGHNVFLTGAAGSGKTYLLNQFIQYLKAKRISVGITASTGIAATHMQGITLHSWAGIGIRNQASDKEILDLIGTKYLNRRLQKTQVLIIDEISMLDAERLDLAEKVIRLARQSFEPFGGMQVVLCGDFFQLPPVSNAEEAPPRLVYKSAAWQNMKLKVCYLHEQHRQGDQELLKILNAIRSDKVDEEVVEKLKQCRATSFAPGYHGRYVRLYSHNMDVDWENRRELGKIVGSVLDFKMVESGIPAITQSLKMGCLAPEKLTLKKGAAVMFVKNNFEKGYVNGSLGTISGFNEDGHPVVMLRNGNEITAEPANWSVEENGSTLAKITQIPLRLAWAITVHKSQGMTLDAAQEDLSRSFVRGMGYVALSRVRSLAGLRLLGFNALALKVDEEILKFDQELKTLSEQAGDELQNAPQVVRELQPAEPYSVEENEPKSESSFKRWTPEEDEMLLEGSRAGMDISQLAERLGRKNSRVQVRLKKLAADALKRQVNEQSQELW